MRVKDFLKLYHGWSRIQVEVYASVTVFSKEHYVLMTEFELDCKQIYVRAKDNYLSEEVIGFEIVSDKLRIFIRGCE